jgi:predicted alpha/beta-fold hydrolase
MAVRMLWRHLLGLGLRRSLLLLVALYAFCGWLRKGLWLGLPVVLSKRGDARMAAILARMRDTLGERFVPAPLAHGAYTQMALMLVWRAAYRRSVAHRFERHTLATADGGEVWVEEFVSVGAGLPADAPVLLVLHTITGVAEDEVELCHRARVRGMRPFVLSRRGHAGPLRSARFNVMGCTRDTELQVRFVRARHPGAFVACVGVSAGSGQVVSYVGRQEELERAEAPGLHRVDCAVSLCPAYDITGAFAHFDRQSPWLAAYLLDGLKRFFLLRNAAVLAGQRGYDEGLAAPSVQRFIESVAPLAGFDSFDSFLRESNPMRHYHKSTVPCLVLNALDDPLCVEANIRKDIASETDNYALVLTACGSHVAFREGLLGQSSYQHRLALDFCVAARLELRGDGEKLSRN